MHECLFVLRSLSNIQYRVSLLSANFILTRFRWRSIFKLNAPSSRAHNYVVHFRNFVSLHH